MTDNGKIETVTEAQARELLETISGRPPSDDQVAEFMRRVTETRDAHRLIESVGWHGQPSGQDDTEGTTA